MDDHDRWMAACLEAAEEAGRNGEFPNGACVVVDRNMVAVSGSETEGLSDPTAHAEVLSIRKAAAHGLLAPGATLFSTLEPCAMCLHSASVAGIEEIVYACGRGDVGSAAYVSNMEASTMVDQLLHPLILTHHGDQGGRIATLVTTFLGQASS